MQQKQTSETLYLMLSHGQSGDSCFPDGYFRRTSRVNNGGVGPLNTSTVWDAMCVFVCCFFFFSSLSLQSDKQRNEHNWGAASMPYWWGSSWMASTVLCSRNSEIFQNPFSAILLSFYLWWGYEFQVCSGYFVWLLQQNAGQKYLTKVIWVYFGCSLSPL